MEIFFIFGLIMAIEYLIKRMILALFNFVGSSILAKYISSSFRHDDGVGMEHSFPSFLTLVDHHTRRS